MATINLEVQVSVDLDDASSRNPSSTYSRLLPNVPVGNAEPPATDFGWTSGFRFRNVTIPNGATILSATFTVKALDDEASTVCRSSIHGEPTDNAGGWPPNVGDFKARVDPAFGTTAKVAWSPVEAFSEDVEYTSPDITDIIQEIVNRVGWVSGNSLAIIWNDWDDDSDTGAHRNSHSYDSGDGSDAPILNVSYRDGAVLSGQVIRIMP